MLHYYSIIISSIVVVVVVIQLIAHVKQSQVAEEKHSLVIE